MIFPPLFGVLRGTKGNSAQRTMRRGGVLQGHAGRWRCSRGRVRSSCIIIDEFCPHHWEAWINHACGVADLQQYTITGMLFRCRNSLVCLSTGEKAPGLRFGRRFSSEAGLRYAAGQLLTFLSAHQSLLTTPWTNLLFIEEHVDHYPRLSMG